MPNKETRCRLLTFFFLLAPLASQGGCSNTPDPVPLMDAVSLSETIQKAKTTPNVFEAEEIIATVLSDPTLKKADRLDALLTRARVRHDAKYNRPAALEDINAALSLFDPADPAASEWADFRDELALMIQTHASRLQGMQNISDWADDKIGLGEVRTVAERYRKARLTPSEGQTQLLDQAGFICPSTEEGRPIHRFGTPPAYIRRLVWCNVDVLP